MLLLGAALAFGIARWLEVSAIPFLVLVGVVLTRMGSIPPELVQQALVLGLTFLLFVAGLELNPRRAYGQRITAFRVGILQFFTLGVLGFGAALLLGFELLVAAYVGLALAASSTLVIVQLLQRRRQLFEPAGRLIVGVLLLQDLLVILTIPLLSNATGGWFAIARGFIGTLALVALAYFSMRLLTPRLATLRMDSEVLLLSALGILAVFIGLAHWLSLPLAAGAFLAGVALSSFPVRGILRGQLGPVGDFFSAIFFIALGGLIGPLDARELMHAAAFTGLLLLVTPPLVTAIAERAGFPARSALESGLLLAQTSELSLVLALQGLVAGQLDRSVFTTLALVTVVTMVLTPMLTSEPVVQRLMRLQPIRRIQRAAPPSQHVLLVGCGSGGMPLLETLFAAGFEVVAIDDDPEVIDRLQRGDVQCIRGDAADVETLIAAGATQARVISSTIRRPRDNQRLLELVHGPHVLVRVFDDADAAWVHALGGTPIVYSEAAADEFIEWFDHTFGEATDRRANDRPKINVVQEEASRA